MRLICPNCDAQYEVDPTLIPASGRDVQCSNCGTTWFMEPPAAMQLSPESRVSSTSYAPAGPQAARSGGADGHDGLTDEAAAFFAQSKDPEADGDDDHAVGLPAASDDPAQPSVELYDEAGALPPIQRETVVEDGNPAQASGTPAASGDRSDSVRHDMDAETGVVTVEPEAHVEPAPSRDVPDRPEIDAAVLSILKAEAERETAARRAEAEGIESQPDLGIDEPGAARGVIDARTARLRGDDEEATGHEVAGRRSLLPDVDEINSTLTATSDRAGSSAAHMAETPEDTRKRRSGFRVGFSLMMLGTAALILLYLFAPQIGEQLPALEPVLARYVDWANGVRVSVDGYLERSVNALTTFLIGLSG